MANNSICSHRERKRNKARDKPKIRDCRMLLVWSLLTAALFVFELPVIFDTLSDIRQSRSMQAYADEFHRMTKQEIEQEKERVRVYNAEIAQKQMQNGFWYQGAEAGDPLYESLLSRNTPGDDANIMAILDIPKINLYLPVGHGTSDGLLQYAAGHMYGSSLPLGGKDTNAILAGHTGLSTAKLFTDIKKLQPGDEVRIHVLDEIHRYRILNKKTVQQGPDEPPLLQMHQNADEITLYTCTPFGINDSRIILRAERIFPDLQRETEETNLMETEQKMLRRLLLCLVFPVCTGSLGIITNRIISCNRWNRIKYGIKK
ncbi:MAG: class C sortase [Eubacterium sp.]|nr:class C sortase [Eubacterium sp.]